MAPTTSRPASLSHEEVCPPPPILPIPKIHLNQLNPSTEAQAIPEISFSTTTTTANKTYLLVSIDLDGPFPSFSILSPILHWIQPSLHPTPSNDNTTTTLKANAPFIANWIGPEPPPGSGPHRYVFLLYEQPEGFEVQRYAPGAGKEMGIWGRVRFDLDGFEREVGLGEVVAVNYFLSN